MDKGIELLERTLGKVDIMGTRRWDEDSPVQEYLDTFALCETANIYTARTIRARIRYLAALFPTMPTVDLPRAIHTLLGGDLRVQELRDIRFIVKGLSIRDGRSLGEPPIERIQMAGGMLARGETYMSTAAATGLSYNMVRDIDNYLGLTKVYEQWLIEQAVYARNDKVSVRKFAERVGLTKSTAHRLLNRAWDKSAKVVAELEGK